VVVPATSSTTIERVLDFDPELALYRSSCVVVVTWVRTPEPLYFLTMKSTVARYSMEDEAETDLTVYEYTSLPMKDFLVESE
jgi:hypothetical protein